ncbi:unnamed protein product [Urochloa decumbens]|uniref:BHLH domain-containing protein n=1 Tax=Urochloa decumbens TaxID=240449 RepID=A0ABC9B6D1_9POAL
MKEGKPHEGKIKRTEVMDKPNQWYSESSQPEPEQDELAYTYQQEEQQAGMQQQFEEAAMAPNNPFRHPLNMFQRFGSASALPNLSFGGTTPGAVKNEQGQPSSSSMGILSFGGQSGSTLNFSGGDDWPDVAIEGIPLEPPERRNRSQLSTQEHVVAERKRREKMQQQFVALATMVPDLTKADKISILGSTIKYVQQLEERVKTLEKQSARTSSESTRFEGRNHVSSTDSQDTPGPSRSTYGVFSPIPTVEATIHDDTILLRICCERKSGLLVMIISELESLNLSIQNTSVVPFGDTYFSINITAKVGEGFSTTVELVKNLTMALRGFS